MKKLKLLLLIVVSCLWGFAPTTIAQLQTAVDLWISNESSAIATYGEINTWDTSGMTQFSSFGAGLFTSESTFNEDLNNWDVSNVTDMSLLFRLATSFNGNISSWNVSSVTNMKEIFTDATNFNQDISNWNVSNVTTSQGMTRMFESTSFNQNISSWNVSNAVNMWGMFRFNTSFNQDISGWNVSSVENMGEMFKGASSFNQDISGWNVSSVTTMTDMFLNADALSDDNKCAIHTAFSSNGNWPYSWSSTCPATSCTITGTSGFRMMSSPASGQIYGDLLDELWTQDVIGGDLTSAGEQDNIWTFDASDQSWSALTNISASGDNLTAGHGFLVYVFQDTDYSGDGDNNLTSGVDLEVSSGTTNTGSITVDISSLSSISSGEYFLAGNPYGYTIDFDLITKSNLTNTTYVWDNVSGAYKTYNGSGDLTNGLIAPFQAFWVIASSSSSVSFTIEEADISTDSGTFYRKKEDSTGSVELKFMHDSIISTLYLSFNNDGLIELDDYDAYRLLPLNKKPHLTSMTYQDEKALSINNLPYFANENVNIELDVMSLDVNNNNFVTDENEIIMQWNLDNLPEHISLYLIDNISNVTTNINNEDELIFTTVEKGSFNPATESGISSYPKIGESRFILSVAYGSSNDTCITDTDGDTVCDELEIVGCQDETACNYDETATDSGDCTYPETYYNCDGTCTTDIDCNGECGGNAVEDECGACGGNITDVTQCDCLDGAAMDCNDVCGGDAVEDECGVCGGSGTPENYDCDGKCTTDIDCNGECGGNAVEDECGICNGDNLTCTGCMYDTACNYDIDATISGDCTYAEQYYNCDSTCITDTDEDGVCDELEVVGCQDETACNYNADATDDDDSCTYAEENYDCDGNCTVLDECGVCGGNNSTCTGCMDETACNFNDCNGDEVLDDPCTIEDNQLCSYPEEVYLNCDGSCINDSNEDGICDELSLYGGLIPEDFSIHSIYPNPFNPVTNIIYGLPEHVNVQIIVYDLSGKQVETLINQFQTPGYHAVNWDADNLPSGVYLIRMDSGDFIQIQKVVLVK